MHEYHGVDGHVLDFGIIGYYLETGDINNGCNGGSVG
jgi:hypothetical protein